MGVVRDLGQFAWDVINNWAVYTTGGVVIAFIWLRSVVWNKTIKPESAKRLTLIIFCFAAFLAWREQYHRANDLASRPKIDLSENLDWTAVSTELLAAAPGGPVEHTIKTPLNMAVVISIRNMGVPTVLENWGLHLIWPDGKEQDIWPWILPPYNDNQLVISIPGSTRPLTFPKKDYLLQKTTIPIPSGGMVRGFLWYPFPADLTLEKVSKTKAQIISLDVAGGTHAVDLRWGVKNDGPQYPVLPGIGDAQ